MATNTVNTTDTTTQNQLHQHGALPHTPELPKSKGVGKFDLYQTVTDKIIEAIEAGIQRNGKPLWSGAGATGMPYNRKSGKTYSGVNVLMLWMAAQEAGYSTAAWLTFKQARELGANAVVGIDLDYEVLGEKNGMLMVSASGTAVVVQG